MASEARTILVVEDEKAIADIISAYLEKEGFTVSWAKDGAEGLSKFRSKSPDLVVLDLMLPFISGEKVIASIRETSSLPVIMLTAKSSESDIVAGLDLGADDYITKPFSIRELVARVKALLRRKNLFAPAMQYFTFGKFRIDFIGRTVTCDDRMIEMSSKEFDLLKFFIENEGKVLSRDEIINRVWGADYFGTFRTVDNFIAKLRHKLLREGIEYIMTARGVGYKFMSTGMPQQDKGVEK